MKNTKTLYFSAKQTNMQSGESHQEDMGTRRILFILSMFAFPRNVSSFHAGTRMVRELVHMVKHLARNQDQIVKYLAPNWCQCSQGLESFIEVPRCGKGALALVARPRRPCHILHSYSTFCDDSLHGGEKCSRRDSATEQ